MTSSRLGLDWSAASIKYYVDGKLVRQVSSSKAGCLDQPMSIILSVETTGDTPTSFNSYTSQVEYVRRWTVGSSPITTPAPTTKAPTTKAPTTKATTTKATTTKQAATVCGAGQDAALMAGGTCPSGSHVRISSAADCNEAAEELGSLDDETATQINKQSRPKGCYYQRSRLWFNTGGKDVGAGSRKSLCCTVGADGGDDDEAVDDDDDEPAEASVCGQGMAAVKMATGVCPSSSHSLVRTKADCQEAAAELEYPDVVATQISKGNRPKGCYVRKNRLWFNTKGKSSTSKARQSICCAAAVGKAAPVSHASAAFPGALVATEVGGAARKVGGSTIGATVGCLVLVVAALAIVAAKHRGGGGRSGSTTITEEAVDAAALEEGGAGDRAASLKRTASYGAAVVAAVDVDTDAVSAGAGAGAGAAANDATSEFEAVNFALVDGDIRAVSIRRGNPAFELVPAHGAVDVMPSL